MTSCRWPLKLHPASVMKVKVLKRTFCTPLRIAARMGLVCQARAQTSNKMFKLTNLRPAHPLSRSSNCRQDPLQSKIRDRVLWMERSREDRLLWYPMAPPTIKRSKPPPCRRLHGLSCHWSPRAPARVPRVRYTWGIFLTTEVNQKYKK